MDKYEELKCIGRGAFGTAHLVTLRGTNEKYVVKKIPIELLTEKEKAQSFREVELLAKLKHPNVVEYRENFVKDNVIHIVMAYCDGGDLAEKIRERVALLEQTVASAGDCTRAYFDIGQILDWFVQMAMAIKYLHQQRILHRDLKTSNIFLTTENVIKLGDFGIAKTLDSTLDQARTVVGTPYYMSPEVCESKPYSYASDVWSLGCVLYEMCALKHAFDGQNIIGLIFTILQKEVAPVPAHYDAEISSLLKQLLDKSPERRPSMDQIFTIPYIRNHMQGLVASGGSLRANAVVRRPLGAPRRRVHAKNLMRRASIDKRKPLRSSHPPQWVPITPLDAEELQLLERTDESDLELLDASISEEPQLDLRAPERSQTPEPLASAVDDDDDDVEDESEMKPLAAPAAVPVTRAFGPPSQQQRPALAASTTVSHVHAWTAIATTDSGESMVSYDGSDALHSQFQDEAEALMRPDFENAYSEECMDSLQIYYSAKSAKAKGRREHHGQFRRPTASEPSSRSRQQSLQAFRPRQLAFETARQDTAAAHDDESHSGAMHRFPLHVDALIDYTDDDDDGLARHALSATAAYEQWGRYAAHDDVTLELEDASLDNVEMRELRALGPTDSVYDDDDGDESSSSDRYDDSSDDDDDYTSLSEYEAEENFYSDDSDFYDEDDGTQYSDDFDDADAEVIEYAHDDAFAPDDSSALTVSVAAAPDDDDARMVSSPAASALTAPATSRLEALSVLSPTGRTHQKPATEVQWVMQNVAASLLQSHDDVTVA